MLFGHEEETALDVYYRYAYMEIQPYSEYFQAATDELLRRGIHHDQKKSASLLMDLYHRRSNLSSDREELHLFLACSRHPSAIDTCSMEYLVNARLQATVLDEVFFMEEPTIQIAWLPHIADNSYWVFQTIQDLHGRGCSRDEVLSLMDGRELRLFRSLDVVGDLLKECGRFMTDDGASNYAELAHMAWLPRFVLCDTLLNGLGVLLSESSDGIPKGVVQSIVVGCIIDYSQSIRKARDELFSYAGKVIEPSPETRPIETVNELIETYCSVSHSILRHVFNHEGGVYEESLARLDAVVNSL
ncbi:MAG: hypothetical protein GXY15_10150 [Candidatus Hydrogenedentes bacterium]|nr:hypothetical protein [Candidatus Hydrogenedentota bacterium]